MITDCTATIFKPRANLGALPPVSEVVFPDLYGWSPISTTTLTNTLGIDKGLWGTWRNRGITPAPMPEAWFRRAAGRPLVYRVDHILTWLAGRRGDQLDTLTTWRLSLQRDFGHEATDPTEVQKLAAMYARASGPHLPGGVTFTQSGFQAYIASLLSSK